VKFQRLLCFWPVTPDLFPVHDFTDDVMPGLREGMAAMLGDVSEPPKNVIREEIVMPGYKGAPDVRANLYKPRTSKDNTPAYLHIHGGGMNQDTEHRPRPHRYWRRKRRRRSGSKPRDICA